MKITRWLILLMLAAVALFASGCAHHYYDYGYPSHPGYWGPYSSPYSWYGYPCF
ncbi:MAG: hypothetical protein AAB466_01765 [Verrucomicrobiota bacterium]